MINIVSLKPNKKQLNYTSLHYDKIICAPIIIECLHNLENFDVSVCQQGVKESYAGKDLQMIVSVTGGESWLSYVCTEQRPDRRGDHQVASQAPVSLSLSLLSLQQRRGVPIKHSL